MITRQPEPDLKSHVGRIKKPQIDIIVKNTGSAAERQNAIFVGKRVKAVMVPLGDLKRRVERHPVKQIRQLAQTTANSSNDLALRKLHSLKISSGFSRFADLTPKRKCLAGFYQDSINRRAGDFDIFDLILL